MCAFYSYDDFDDYGYFEAEDRYGDWTELNDNTLDDGYYYYFDWEDASGSNGYGLDGMTFVADRNADEDTLEIPFTMYGDGNDEVDGTLYIEIGEGTGTSSKADFVYQVEPGRRCDAGCRGLLRPFSTMSPTMTSWSTSSSPAMMISTTTADSGPTDTTTTTMSGTMS